ncbi:class F sortase, partial [Kitasatospora sp. NPDC048540]|uniref:class F sortase n=1 Tax=Kitasatospora sp. NPDC048540 TaxID=3155634 RepID=UPI0033BFCBCE
GVAARGGAVPVAGAAGRLLRAWPGAAAAVGALSLTLGVVVVACGSDHPPVRIGAAQQVPATSGTQAPATGTTGTTATTGTAGTVPAPVRLEIPRIGVDAPVQAGGLNADGTVEVPPLDRPDLVDWYRGGPAPGQIGPAVLLGHLDTHKGPAVFGRLPQLRPGDRIDIRRQDGSSVSYRVRELRQFAKSEFPTELVYGNTETAQLRLITCGGTLGSNGHYTDNIVVLADLATP